MEELNDKIERLESENALLLKEVKKLRGTYTMGEKLWKNVVKFGGLLLMFLPFIPNALFYVGLNDAKAPLATSDWLYVAAGAMLMFGQEYLGELLNSLGKKILKK